MNVNYFDLSGGINQATTKTQMGATSGKLYWHDGENIEIYDNKGIIKQNGNTLFFSLPEHKKICAMQEFEIDNDTKLAIATENGNIYIYSKNNDSLTLINHTLTGNNIHFVSYLRGVICYTNSDEMFYIKGTSEPEIISCNLRNRLSEIIYPSCVTIYKGRVWCAKGATIYYSALGEYNDFTTSDDAGYINDFHTDTSDIYAMHTYKDYLAIYKKDKVYLLSGSNPSDFSITLFADKGTLAKNAIVNVDNKQYFFSNGIFPLEQVGELNQIRLGSDISTNIKKEFQKIETGKIYKTIALNYRKKNQTWYFFPFLGKDYFNTIWINDYQNKAWYKRVVPQNITSACLFKDYILTADEQGNIYYEDYGTSFNGKSIPFMWKSPFLSLGEVHKRKLIDEFYFVLDDEQDNNFQCSIFKDYDSTYSEDYELIKSIHYNSLIWANDNETNEQNYCWNSEESQNSIWAISSDTIEKAEICGSCYAIQICIEGKNIEHNCAVIGLQFREIYNDEN